MTMANERAERPVVTVLRRPPVRQSTLVRASAQHTFTTFVTTIGAWWPAQPFSAGKDRVREITVEQRQGGRVYETWDDGTDVDWGTLVTWQPPRTVRHDLDRHTRPDRGGVHLRRARPGPDPGDGGAPLLGGTHRRTAGRRLRAARRLRLWRLLPRLGNDPGQPGQGGYQRRSPGRATAVGDTAATGCPSALRRHGPHRPWRRYQASWK